MRLGVNGRFYEAAVTGVQRFARAVVAGLTHQAEVTVFLPAGVDLPPEAEMAVRCVRGRLSGPLWEQLELPGLVKSANVDVVLHPANAAPVRGGPYVVVLHDVTPWTHGESFTRLYRTWARVAHGRAARRAAAVVTVSPSAADDVTRILDLPRERVHVALQGAAPLDAPPTEAQVSEVRRQLALPERWFLAVGTDPRKGVDLLADVWAGPCPPAAPLVIVGRRNVRIHPERTPVRVPEGVRLVGAVGDETLRALYGGSVALLFPSRAEGFGRPPLEALACGTRALSGPCPAVALLDGAVDLVDGGRAAWREAVDTMMSEAPHVRADRIRRGRAIAATFTWERTTRAVLKACAAAAGSSGRAPARGVGRMSREDRR
jgi:glycosyltransferase involved in cell wall biosynthesis